MKLFLQFLNLFFLSFPVPAQIKTDWQFDQKFMFGLASAAAHSEDQLDDIWKKWAEAGKIKAFQKSLKPQDRLKFWSDPDTEIDLAAQTGIQIYRLSVDWGRIQPHSDQFDQSVLDHYRDIIKKIKNKNMKVMLTLMHHSVPFWFQNKGGWKSPQSKQDFIFFAQRLIKEFHEDVDYWITFNEANVFISLSYVVGMWPPGDQASPWALMSLGPLKGSAVQAMDFVADAHNETYQWAHEKYPKIQMGIAHNMAYYTSKSWWGLVGAWYMNKIMNWYIPEKIRQHVDFFGFNYYGAEWIKGTKIDVNDPDEEYSEAGRAINPEGLRFIIKNISQDYAELPIFITENGIADATDILRPAYLIEHLKVIHEEIMKGSKIMGYIFWTLSDNMEWSDGYCPKFGLVDVDREHDLTRTPRPSYYLFSDIVHSKKITQLQRDSAVELVRKNRGQPRPFCRDDDGVSALDQPQFRPMRWKIK